MIFNEKLLIIILKLVGMCFFSVLLIYFMINLLSGFMIIELRNIGIFVLMIILIVFILFMIVLCLLLIR